MVAGWREEVGGRGEAGEVGHRSPGLGASPPKEPSPLSKLGRLAQAHMEPGPPSPLGWRGNSDSGSSSPLRAEVGRSKGHPPDSLFLCTPDTEPHNASALSLSSLVLMPSQAHPEPLLPPSQVPRLALPTLTTLTTN